MKRISMIAVAVMGLAMSAGAYANCNGRGCDTPTPSGGNNTAYGGQGGAGGHGTGVGVGIGKGGTGYGGAGGQGGAGGRGGSVLGSGNSSNVNANTNKQAQGQMQGQAQSSKNSNRNANANNNRSSATGGNSQANNSNSNANSGNNSDQSVTVNGDTYEARRIPVATAYAPNIAPTATCMGASSAGVQAPGLGISVGTSWTDENCMKLERVRTVAVVLNDPETAAAMLCDVPDYAKAREASGRPCGTKIIAAAALPPLGTLYTVATVESQGQPEQARVATAPALAPVVSPVPPTVERYRVTLAGLQPL